MKSTGSPASPFVFAGFSSPNTTAVPDQAFDEIMPLVSPTQWKVLCYIMRRTYGFKKASDSISLTQICSGITTKSGKILDRGTGLSRSTVIEALYGRKNRTTKRISVPGLIALGIVLLQSNTSRLGDADPNTYRLRMKGDTREDQKGERNQGASESASRDAIGARDGAKRSTQLAHERPPDASLPKEGGSPQNRLPWSANQTTVVRETDYIQPDRLQLNSSTDPDRPDRDLVDGEDKNKNKKTKERERKPPFKHPPLITKTDDSGSLSSRATTHDSINPNDPNDLNDPHELPDHPTRGGAPRRFSYVLERMMQDGIIQPASAVSAPHTTKASRRAVQAREASNSLDHAEFPSGRIEAPGNGAQAHFTSFTSARVSQLVTEICAEFHDPKVNATISQIHRLWWRTGMSEQAFTDWLITLRSEVRQRMRQGGVRKPMGYFMQTLKNAVSRGREQAGEAEEL